MTCFLDDMPPRRALAEIARDFHARGWMAGTAGNLSARAEGDDGGFWITASGRPKGRLTPEDFLLIDVASGAVLERAAPAARPSAEAAIHRVLYRLFPAARACLHVHTVDACLAGQGAAPDATELPLPPLEMLKGLGVWEEQPRVALPLFANWLEVERIAAEIERRLQAQPPCVPGLLIRGHGVTVWGENLTQAYNRVEVLEFLMSYLARAQAATPHTQ